MRIAVIGAGAGGLATAKALRDAGLTPVIYEETGDIGGLWLYRERSRGGGPAYRSLRTNTSKQVTAFSDFPFPEDAPDFPPRATVEEYLQQYAADAGLLPHIRFGTRLRAVEPRDRGRWQLTLVHGAGTETEVVDAAVVCTGIFRCPVLPSIRGLEGFSGRVSHSLDYRVPEDFAGQHVLVVGLGSSAVDIALDLLETAATVTISTRRGAWLVPHTVNGRPVDHQLSRLAARLPRRMQNRARRRLLELTYAQHGVEDPLALWQRAHVPFSPESAPSVTSDALMAHLLHQEVDLRPAISYFNGADVVFSDGSSSRPDTVIFATGYHLDFPFLPPAFRPWTEAGTGLYRLVFPPEHPTLPFVGVCRVRGPIFPIVEMQARWVASVLAGASRLPPGLEMHAEIQARRDRQLAHQDSPIRVALLPYLDELAGLIGAKPRLWRHPCLLRALLAGPPVAAQFRLDGPHRWPGAAAYVASLYAARPGRGTRSRP